MFQNKKSAEFPCTRYILGGIDPFDKEDWQLPRHAPIMVGRALAVRNALGNVARVVLEHGVCPREASLSGQCSEMVRLLFHVQEQAMRRHMESDQWVGQSITNQAMQTQETQEENRERRA